VPGILSDEDMSRVRDAGYEVEILEDLEPVAAERLGEVSRTNRFADARGVMEFGERTVLGYMTTAEVDSALANLATLHPDLVTLITLPHATWQGRTSRAVRIRAGTATARPGVLFTGGVHAREWGGSDICLAFMVNLIQAYRNNATLTYGGKTFPAADVRALLEHVDLYVFPNVNPDGKEYSQTADPGSGQGQSVWWRKNRNPNAATGGTAVGVDVNRNFAFLWNSGIGTSTSPSAFTYRGTGAFSEPETRNVQHMFEAFPNIRYYVDIHSYGGLILYHWGDDDNQGAAPQQNFLNPVFDGTRGVVGDTAYREFLPAMDERTVVGLAERMSAALTAVRGTAYTVQQSVGLYPTSATSDDYAFSRHIADASKGKVYGYTLEFGTQFVPPHAEMQNVVADVASALTEFCLAVCSDVYVRDNPTDIGTVPSTGSFWNSPDIWVRNVEDGGAAHQNPIRGQDNFVYVRVSNRGAAAASGVRVRVCLATWAGTEFVWPNDWVPRNPAGGGSITAPGTYLLGESAPVTVGAGGSAVVHVRWNAALVPPEANWHPCLLVEVSPDDGPTATGSHVWESNNLGQKNLTIVNAARGELVRFAFEVGSEWSVDPAELVVHQLSGPDTLGVHLDLQDEGLLEKLRPQLGTGPFEKRPGNGELGFLGGIGSQGKLKIPLDTPLVTLLRPTKVALPARPRTGALDALVVGLPGGTKLRPRLSWLRGPHGRAAQPVVGFELVEPKGTPMLALTGKSGRLPLGKVQRKPLALELRVPESAVPGDVYEVEAVQQGADGRPVGGVVLQVHVRE
jgi:carboxypeptidase T